MPKSYKKKRKQRMEIRNILFKRNVKLCFKYSSDNITWVMGVHYVKYFGGEGMAAGEKN